MNPRAATVYPTVASIGPLSIALSTAATANPTTASSPRAMAQSFRVTATG